MCCIPMQPAWTSCSLSAWIPPLPAKPSSWGHNDVAASIADMIHRQEWLGQLQAGESNTQHYIQYRSTSCKCFEGQLGRSAQQVISSIKDSRAPPDRASAHGQGQSGIVSCLHP